MPSAPTCRESAQRFDSAPPLKIDGAAAVCGRCRLPLETVTFRAAPGAQIHLQSRSRSGDDDGLAGARLPQGALQEQIAAFGEPERVEVYAHLT